MRTSSIKHPVSSRFVQIFEYLVKAVGRDAAAVLGQLDFLDRAQQITGLAIASRQWLLADLEGLVTTYGVDKSLALLVDKGWVNKMEREEVRGRNLTKVHEYALVAEAVNDFIENQNAGVANSERRRFEPGFELGCEPGFEPRFENETSTNYIVAPAKFI